MYNWTWPDGSAITYMNWAKGQSCVIYDDCCLVQNSTDQKWYIQTCEQEFPDQPPPPQLPYICELKVATTPAPVTTTPWPGNCPNGWAYNSANQKCYIATMEGEAYLLMTFNDTRTFCQQNYGADLASIHSQQENDFIVSKDFG